MTAENLEIVIDAMADKIKAQADKIASMQTDLDLKQYEIKRLKAQLEEKEGKSLTGAHNV